MPEDENGTTKSTYLTWSASLSEFTPKEIIRGVNKLIKASSRFAPNLGAVRSSIIESMYADAHDAYKEACNKASQPLHQDWSHVVVYIAGKETGFYELRSSKESEIFKIFSKKYLDVCTRHRGGEEMFVPVPKEQRIPQFISNEKERKEARRSAINEMREIFSDNNFLKDSHIADKPASNKEGGVFE